MNPAFRAALRIDAALDELKACTVSGRETAIAHLAARYDREKDLPRLAPKLVGRSDAEIRAGLERAIAGAQKQLGHWTGNGPFREWELQAALLAEQAYAEAAE